MECTCLVKDKGVSWKVAEREIISDFLKKEVDDISVMYHQMALLHPESEEDTGYGREMYDVDFRPLGPPGGYMLFILTMFANNCTIQHHRNEWDWVTSNSDNRVIVYFNHIPVSNLDVTLYLINHSHSVVCQTFGDRGRNVKSVNFEINRHH